MGHKVHPVGFRIGIIRDWQSKWYDEQHYASNILEDVNLRKAIRKKYPEAGISLVEIERQANRVGVIIHTARPGIVIGRGGSRVEEMRQYLESHLGGKKVQLDVREIRQPELDALLVARSVAEQMERRVAYRRAMKQSIFRTMQAGAKGMRIICSGRLGGAEIARRQLMHQGRVPLQTLRADIDYGFTEAHTTLGRIGIKVWVYKGDIFPEAAPVIETPIIVETPPLAVVKLVEAKTEAPVTPNATPIEIKKPRTRRKPADETPTEAKAEAPAIEEAAKKVTRPRVRKVTEETTPAAKPETGEKVSKPRAVKPKATESPEIKPKTKKAAE
jgi:small subunit ribosomal protein S3